MESKFNMTEEEQQPFRSKADCEPKSGEKQPVESVNVINPATCIPYPKAMRLLQERIDVTPEDMAAWVFYGPEMGGLEAYLDVSACARVFNYWLCLNSLLKGHTDYVLPLMHCWFLRKDIENFNPVDRYIAGKELIEHWSKQSGIQPIA